MACRALWITTSEKSFYSDVLSETDFMYSTVELEKKDAECMFCNRKHSKDERGEIWIKCFGCSLWVHLDCTAAENAEYVCEFYKQNQSRNVFMNNLKNITFIAKNNYD